jgi:hypothetical protein
MKVSTVGLDLAKNVFQVHAVDEAGEVIVRKALRRGRVLPFFEGLEPCLIGPIGGLTPLMFEYSLQVQFLIPMVLAVIFGLMAAMVPVLFVVPAPLAIEGDLARITRRGRMHGPAAEQAPLV